VDLGVVIATGGLVLATGALAFFTRALVAEAQASRREAENTRREMEQARHLSVRPRLTFDPHVLGGRIGVLLIRNLGAGAAFDVRQLVTYRMGGEVRGSVQIGGETEKHDWSEPSFAPGERHEIKLPRPYLENLMKAAGETPLLIEVKGACTDLYGRGIPIEASINVSLWAERVEAAGERVDGRHKYTEVAE